CAGHLHALRPDEALDPRRANDRVRRTDRPATRSATGRRALLLEHSTLGRSFRTRIAERDCHGAISLSHATDHPRRPGRGRSDGTASPESAKDLQMTYSTQ